MIKNLLQERCKNTNDWLRLLLTVEDQGCVFNLDRSFVEGTEFRLCSVLYY